ncbi:MAG: hypothetical protein HYR97_04285 [Candidatus Melainabacteria bacterium]|nr:hypothetical protein [Candidatus Melainabacteria bacterium]MBI3308024.1 hypothetical protein [Candidatus Melainabacteria bacterium]
MLQNKKIKLFSVVLFLLLFIGYISKCNADTIPSTDIDTYKITLNGDVLNDVAGLNIFIQIKDNKASIKPNVTFSSQGAIAILSSVTGPQADQFTISLALSGNITNGQGVINGNFVEESILPGAEFSVIKIERDGGVDITSSLTKQIEFINSVVEEEPPIIEEEPEEEDPIIEEPEPIEPPIIEPPTKPIKTPKGAKSPTDKLIEQLGNKLTISFIDTSSDLNTAFINLFVGATQGSKKKVDISSTVSVEIKNAPPIPEGTSAKLELPEINEFTFFEEDGDLQEIPKGFSLATDISFNDLGETAIVSDEDLSKQNTAILVDASGRKFVVGFGFLKKIKELAGFRRPSNRNYKFQTVSGEPLELVSTITIPADATEGDAKVSILNKDESLATIQLRIAPPTDVKIAKKKRGTLKTRAVGKPQIKEPITAVIDSSGKNLLLEIKGTNFIQNLALIDGALERLAKKSSFTNVTFTPTEGIKIKKITVRKKAIKIKAEIEDDIEPGIKLFNVITPKGADIGAIVIPDPLIGGTLQSTSVPEDLILE